MDAIFCLAAHPLLIGGLLRGDDGRGQGDRTQGLSLMEGEDLQPGRPQFGGPELELQGQGLLLVRNDESAFPLAFQDQSSLGHDDHVDGGADRECDGQGRALGRLGRERHQQRNDLGQADLIGKLGHERTGYGLDSAGAAFTVSSLCSPLGRWYGRVEKADNTALFQDDGPVRDLVCCGEGISRGRRSVLMEVECVEEGRLGVVIGQAAYRFRLGVQVVEIGRLGAMNDHMRGIQAPDQFAHLAHRPFGLKQHIRVGCNFVEIHRAPLVWMDSPQPSLKSN